VKLGGVQWTTLVDDPGHVAAIVFCAGCNFRCPYCHNPELVLPDQVGALPSLPMEPVLLELGRRQGFLDSVVVSGGEPTLQPGLPRFLERLKALGFRVKLDTNGSRPDVLDAVLANGWVDFVAMDIKAPLDAYGHMTGVSVDRQEIARSVSLLRQHAPAYEFRTTVAPGLGMDDLLRIGEQLGTAKGYWLQVFQCPIGKRLVDPMSSERPALARELLDQAWTRLAGRFDVGGVRG
jgi:pyruvate formate lyase activating enzyme